MKLTPTLVRMAFHAAAGRGLKFPSLEFEEFVATYLNSIKLVQHVETVTVEEAKKRGLKVPENAGPECQLFSYKPAGEVL